MDFYRFIHRINNPVFFPFKKTEKAADSSRNTCWCLREEPGEILKIAPSIN